MKAQTRTQTAGNCLVCDVPITNPICGDCLRREIMQWLVTQDQSMRGKVEKVGFSQSGSVPCIVCGNRMEVCAHCYIREVYELISDENPRLAQKLIERFDFDFINPF